MTLSVEQPITVLKGVGEQRAKFLGKLGIRTIKELITSFPRRYEDRRKIVPLGGLTPGEMCVQVIINAVEVRKTRSGLQVVEASVSDLSGEATAVWFNQFYLIRQIKPGKHYILWGKAKRSSGGWQLLVDDFQATGESLIHVGRIVPFYNSTRSIPQKWLRETIYRALGSYAAAFPETVHRELRNKLHLDEVIKALWEIHFPSDFGELSAARSYWVFEELLVFELGIMTRGGGRKNNCGIKHKLPAGYENRFLQSLPYQLTGAQVRVLNEIWADMENQKQMSRLVQGDVGSGKTVIAAGAMFKACASGHQGVLMAPTEILARQHYQTFGSLLNGSDIKIGLLTGSLKTREKSLLLEQIAAGTVQVVVATQAVLEDNVTFQNLSLVITDEQHRFGVNQRQLLSRKGSNPDVLVMTATPIPRTLALTFYGDLEVSMLDELPPGRQPVHTFFVRENKRLAAYQYIAQHLARGSQAYVICPLIEENEELDLKAVADTAGNLQRGALRGFKVDLLHGKMPAEDKDRVMTEFAEGRIDVLVTTTVVEVGVNVPNATLILIEGVERFGLAQLHQLRGRVARGNREAYCFMFGDPSSEVSAQRVKTLIGSTDGFKIAEEDLKLRGPGELLGTRQHGLPELKLANLVDDVELVNLARKEAIIILQQDQGLTEDRHRELAARIEQTFRDLAV